MAYEFKLPDIGEGVVEGEVVRWLIGEGDALAEDQPMVEVMTDKATVEIPSPKAGKVERLLYKVGDKVPVGAVLVVIATANGSAAAPVAAPARPQASRPASAPLPAPAPGGKALATPAVRQYARERGVDLASIVGGGPGGRVTREDVDRAASGGGRPTEAMPVPGGPVRIPTAALSSTPEPVSPTAGDRRIPFVGVRRKIAENMARSKRTAAHFTYVEECDVTDLVRLRERAKDLAAARGVKLSFLPFVVRAVVAALKKQPILNATLDEAAGEIVLRGAWHIGVAAATERGLVVPVVRDADRKGLWQLAAEIAELSEKARTGKLAPSDLGGSTFTISSLGALGGVLATPIINFPEVAILGVHQIRKRPAVVDDRIVPRDLMNLSVSLDHRVVDGYEGALFLAEVVRYLQEPALLMLEST